MTTSTTDGFADTRDALAEDGSLECQEESNPFVPMPSRARTILLFLGGAYAVFVAFMALFNSSAGGVSMIGVAFSSLWLIAWTLYPIIFYKPHYGWCHPLILLALLGMLNLVMRNTQLFMYGLNEHLMLPEWSETSLNWLFAYGNIVNSLALMATYFGFASSSRLPVLALRPRSVPPQKLYLVLLVFFGISLAACWSYAQIYGDFYSLLRSLAFGMAKKLELADDVDGLGGYAVLINMATVVAIIWVCAQPKALSNPLFWCLGLTSLALAYLSDGRRSSVIYPTILILLCWMLRNRKVPYLGLAVAGGVAFFLLGLLGLFRSSNWSNSQLLNVDALHETSLAEMGTRSLDELAQRSGSQSTYFPILAKVPQEEGLLYGRTYLEWGLRFIPRQFWRDKPRGVDVQANAVFYGGDWGLPATAVGEAYWNFHLPGVLVVFFLLGVFKRWLAEFLLRYPNAPGVMALYMISVFYFDPSQNGFRNWLYAIIPALLMMALGGLFDKSRSRSAPISPSLRSHSHAA